MIGKGHIPGSIDGFLAESSIRNEMQSNAGIREEIIREHAWHLPRAVTMVQ